jgi:hypothetical protein
MLVPTLTNRISSAQIGDDFRNITLLIGLGPDDAFSIPTDRLCEWIAEFDRWFKETTGIVRGCNLHLLYGRAVYLSPPEVLSRLSTVRRLFEATIEAGLNLSLNIAMSECAGHPAAFERLLECPPSAANIAIDEPALYAPTSACLGVVERLIDKGWNITLVGPIAAIEHWGVLDSELCNAQGFTMIPNASLQMPLLKAVKAHWFSPCHSRLGVYVDEHGILYPCRGLMGSKEYSLGSIFEPPSTSFLAGNRSYRLPLDTLARKGPFVDGVPEQALALERATICQAHRLVLGLPN